eukprot:CAMPEP_0202373628 /NCGR_PEP_ID=MMETSP1127-20130417/4620_1 /ASSEMBLY_ACC=CAM_ASM_000462 /TAXON_ID=3047 /ORGANISM="Dunaliella tertiolecta, Strain CCMP1320" /LENGTH=96 /DNA_ID=CAMNT_0048970569 /DNA_START=204 /DNA_END=494 /DNA_ORIENTATION=+
MGINAQCPFKPTSFIILEKSKLQSGAQPSPSIWAWIHDAHPNHPPSYASLKVQTIHLAWIRCNVLLEHEGKKFTLENNQRAEERAKISADLMGSVP